MSGFEIAGVVLGGIPLIISGLEHWREVAKISGYYTRTRAEHQKCVHEIWYNGILYKRNLKELLHPIVDDSDDVARLLKDPGSVEWKSKTLAERLEDRLQESYAAYMVIMGDMEETIEELKKVLFLDKDTIQNQLSATRINETLQGSVSSTVKMKMTYELFRVRFSFGENKRTELFQRLKTNNERLEKLLSTSDRISLLQNAQPIPTRTKPTFALDDVFAKVRKKSELLFKALQEAWQCSCSEHHLANLRLEHRTVPEFCFEVILMFTALASPSEAHWSWTKLQCGQMSSCIMGKKHLLKPPPLSAPQSKAHYNGPYQPSLPIRLRKKKQVAFHDSTLLPSIELNAPAASGIKLCQTLGTHDSHECMGIIGTDLDIYHLHPLDKLRKPLGDGPYTLDHILSDKFVGIISRRQRYSIALVVASSVAQLQYTTWLTTGLTKKDILFYPSQDDICNIPFHEPFIRQGFASQSGSPDSQAADCNFYSLGILLLELCFGQRLEDYPPRQAYPFAPVDIKQACDTMAALEWSHSVKDESGADYDSAVKWCFTGAKSAGQSWKNDILKKVVHPLESCQEQFKTVGEC